MEKQDKRLPETCPKCGTKTVLDIEPFEGTVVYCPKCQRHVGFAAIEPPRGQEG